MKKRFLSVALAAAVVMSATACTSNPAESKTTAAPAETKAEETTAAKEETEAAGGVLVMATNAEFEPWEYKEGNDIVGIDADISKAICDKLGYELKIEDMSFETILASVNSGKADFGAAGMTVTPEREESVDFTDTYANATQVVIVRK